MYIIGFDIGGTKVEGSLFCLGEKSSSHEMFSFQGHKGEILNGFLCAKKRVPTERHLGYEQIIEKIITIISDLCAQVKIEKGQLAGIGLSVPGPVDPVTKKMLASNSMFFAHKNLPQDIVLKFGHSLPVAIENDANCFAYAESYCGAGLEYFKETGIPVQKQISLGVILGTGCGGGVMVNGDILSGKLGGAGEIGHITLRHDGHPCYCGRRGCAEQYLSGPAFEASFQQRMYAQLSGRGFIGAKEIFELYQGQDPSALAVVKDYQRLLAEFLGTMVTLFDPHYIVCGGGMSLQNIIYENLNEKIKSYCFLSKVETPVYQHKIGDSAGALGAALLVYNQLG